MEKSHYWPIKSWIPLDKGDIGSLTSKVVTECAKEPLGIKPISKKKGFFLQQCLNEYDNSGWWQFIFDHRKDKALEDTLPSLSCRIRCGGHRTLSRGSEDWFNTMCVQVNLGGLASKTQLYCG